MKFLSNLLLFIFITVVIMVYLIIVALSLLIMVVFFLPYLLVLHFISKKIATTFYKYLLGISSFVLTIMDEIYKKAEGKIKSHKNG